MYTLTDKTAEIQHSEIHHTIYTADKILIGLLIKFFLPILQILCPPNQWVTVITFILM